MSGDIRRRSPGWHSQVTGLFFSRSGTSEEGIRPKRWLPGMTFNAPLEAGVGSRWIRKVTIFERRSTGGWTWMTSSLVDHGPYPGMSC